MYKANNSDSLIKHYAFPISYVEFLIIVHLFSPRYLNLLDYFQSLVYFNDIKINYTIQELSNENLRLNTKLRGVDFSFLLERKMKEEIN